MKPIQKSQSETKLEQFDSSEGMQEEMVASNNSSEKSGSELQSPRLGKTEGTKDERMDEGKDEDTLINSGYGKSEKQFTLLMNKLRTLGVSIDIDVPRIAIIGNQSAGKSSVIEAISGITLPRAKGTCTRCPMEVRLSPSTKDWRCEVKLRFERDKFGGILDNIQEIQFGDVIVEKDKVEERLRQAQLAILNPSKDFKTYLTPECDLSASSELSFSTNLVCIDISGPGVASLSFVDLPGFISNAAKGKENSIDLIKNLAREIIKGGNCLILLTLTMTKDIQTQYGAMLAREVDEKGLRNIGVLTKPDAVQEGDLSYWQEVLEGGIEALKHGYFVVKNPSTKDLNDGISFKQARENERALFMRPEWDKLSATSRNRLGTDRLVSHLSNLLEKFIRERIPKLHEQMLESYEKVDKELEKLPREIPDEELVAHFDGICRSFSDDFRELFVGSVENTQLVHSLRRGVFTYFRNRIKSTIPLILPCGTDKPKSKFQQYENKYFPTENDSEDELKEKLGDIYERGEYLIEKVQGNLGHNLSLNSKVTYAPLTLEEIRTRKNKAITRELPGNTPYRVKLALIRTQTKQWRSMVLECSAQVEKVLIPYVDRLVDKHFGCCRQGSLHARVRASVLESIRKNIQEANKHLNYLLDYEECIDTAHSFFFLDTRAKVLTALNERMSETEGVIKPVSSDDLNELRNALSRAGCSKLLEDLQEFLQKPKSSDFEEELEIAAELIAYWKVAFRRVTDLVPGLLDVFVVLRVSDTALETVLKSTGLHSAEALSMCKQYMVEDEETVFKRRKLKAKRARLAQGLEALRAF